MWFLLSFATAADDGWLEADDEAVTRWREDRTAEALDWIGEAPFDAILTSVTDWRKALSEHHQLATHRAGVSLWLDHEPHADNETEPDRDQWRWHRTLSMDRGGVVRDLPLPDGADDTWLPCGNVVAPSGDHVLLGRRPPSDGAFDARETPCHVTLVDLDDLSTTPLGIWPWVALAWPSGGQPMVHTRTRRRARTANRLFALDGTPTGTVQQPGRGMTLSYEDGFAVGWHRGRGKKRHHVRFRLDDGPIVRLPRANWGWAGIDHGKVVLSTTHDAEHRRVVRVDPDAPRRSRLTTLWEDTEEEPLDRARVHADRLLITQERDGAKWLLAHPLTEGTTEGLPFDGPYMWAWGRPVDGDLLVTVREPDGSSYTLLHPDGTTTPIENPPKQPLVFTSSIVPSADDAQIPVSWVRAPDTEADGNAPVWMQVYGGFGHSQRVNVGVKEALWLAHGGILAVVHARGGGERGDAWHDEAKKENLGRTFEDVIAAGEWFIEEGWSTPRRLVVSGTSNGGLTAMATVALRPDLFGAAMSHAGVHDLLGGQDMEGAWWKDEYGRPGDAEQRPVLERYSPLEAKPEDLPPIWVTTGFEDPTVPPAHSYKLVHAWSTLDGGPTLLRVIDWPSHAHHLSKRRREAVWEQLVPADLDRRNAEDLAFLVRALDLDWTSPVPP